MSYTSNHFLITGLFAICCISLTACAQSKPTSTTTTVAASPEKKKEKSRNTKPVLLAAIQEPHLLPNQTEAPAENKFILVWRDKKEPAAFFWQGVQTWQVCNINRAKNYNDKDYSYQSVADPKLVISAGDTLELLPAIGGKHPVPDIVNPDDENLLYYKTADGLWKNIKVTSFERLEPKQTELMIAE